MTDPLAVLKQKRAELGTAAVAKTLDYSEATIRSICTGNYPGDPAKVLAAVALVWIDVVDCPHAGETIGRDECAIRANAPKPFGGAAKLRWWEACRDCQHRASAPLSQRGSPHG